MVVSIVHVFFIIFIDRAWDSSSAASPQTGFLCDYIYVACFKVFFGEKLNLSLRSCYYPTIFLLFLFCFPFAHPLY